MRWTLTLRVAALLKSGVLLLALLVALPALGPSDAQAQSWRQNDSSAIVLPSQPNAAPRRNNNSGGIFRIFRAQPQRQTRQSSTQRQLRPADVQSAPIIALPPPKDPDAITVVTLGDEFADQLREGLVDRFDGDRLIEAVGVSRPGSGLTQMEEFNWNIEALRELDARTQVGAVVVALGYSDRQALIEGTQQHGFGSRQWRDIYRDRVTSFALTLLTEGHPVLFAGLPPMLDPDVNERVRLINQLIEEALAPTRARFVSVYGGFTDAEGNYTRAGPSMAGEVTNLRRSDGVFFNRAGREKFAHFVERFIPREGQAEPEPEVSSVVFEGSGQAETGVGPVLLMTSGFADPTAVLATDAASLVPEDSAVRDRLRDGAVAPPPTGRADSFSWPAQGG